MTTISLQSNSPVLDGEATSQADQQDHVRSWQEISKSKQEIRDSLIPRAWQLNKQYPPGSKVINVPTSCGILTDPEVKITTDYDAIALVGLMKTGLLTCEEVTTAFCKRAAIAQQLTNCLTEIFFDQAIARAKSLDVKRKTSGGTDLGPLFGLPISLKDSFFVPGFDATIGFVANANKPATETGALVDILLELGAVLHCKTNVPQTTMTCDSHNNIWGRTVNPYNTSFTAGGSSGGEGTLIAMGGSIIGIGTDLAGSIRIPAHCNGVYGLKPSSSIVPFGGQEYPVNPGYPYFAVSGGPVARSLQDCRLFLQSLLEAEPWRRDAFTSNLPWVGKNIDLSARKLRIGVSKDNGLYTLTPPIQSTLDQTIQKLEAAGHEIVQINLPMVPEMMTAVAKYFCLDGFKFAKDKIKATNEPVIPSVHNIGFMSNDSPLLSIDEFAQLNGGRLMHIYVYHKLWEENNLDVILTPTSSHTAVPHDKWKSLDYTVIWNYLDSPALSVPCGFVGPEHIKVENGAKYGNVDQEYYEMYSGPVEYSGLPTSIQLIGRKLDDERFLQVADIIDRVINS